MSTETNDTYPICKGGGMGSKTIRDQIDYIQKMVGDLAHVTHPKSNAQKLYVTEEMLGQLCYMLKVIDEERLPELWSAPELSRWIFDIALLERLPMHKDRTRRYEHDVEVRKLLSART